MAEEFESFFGESDAPIGQEATDEIESRQAQSSEFETFFGGEQMQQPEPSDDDISPLETFMDIGSQLSENLRDTIGQRFDAIGQSFKSTPDLFEQTFQGAKMGVLASRVYGSDPLSQQGTRPGMEGSIGPHSMFPSDIAQEEAKKAQAYMELSDEEIKPISEELKEVQQSPEFEDALKKYQEAGKRVEALRPDTDSVEDNFLFDLFNMSIKMVPSIAVGTVTRSPNLGLAVMAGQVYADKTGELTAAGVDPEEIPIHAFATTTIETATEKLPFNLLLKNIGWSGIRKLLTFTVAEGLQEGASSLLQSAWDKNTLRPDLTLGEALRDARYETLLGTAGGPIVGGPSIIYQNMQKNRAYKKLNKEIEALRDRYKEAIETGEMQGPIIPQELREANEAVAEAEQSMVDSAPPSIPLEAHVGEFLKDQDLQLGKLLQLNTRGKGTLNEQDTAALAETLPGYKGVEHTPGEVINNDFTHYQEELMAALEAQAKWEEYGDLLTQSGKPLDGRTIRNIQRTKDDVAKLERLAEVEKEYAQSAAGIIKDYIDNLAPGMKVYIGDNSISEHFKGIGIKEINGALGRTVKTSDGVHVIEFDLASTLDEDGNFVPGLLQETLAHEFGHAVINEYFENSPTEVKEALTNAYLGWLNKATKEESLNKFLKSRHGFFWNMTQAPGKRSRRYDISNMQYLDDIKFSEGRKLFRQIQTDQVRGDSATDWQEVLSNRINNRLTYEFGMTEWTAIQAEKALSEKVSSNPEVQKHFKRINEFLRKLYSHYKESYGYDKTYKEFLRVLQAKASYRAAVETFMERKKEALDNSYEALVQDQVENLMKNAEKTGIFTRPPGRGGSGRWNPPTYTAENFRRDSDTYNKAVRYGATLLQLYKLNPHIEGLRHYVTSARNWWNTKMHWIAQADGHAKEWKSLGGKRAANLGKFLLDLTVESYNLEKSLEPNSPEFQKLAKKWNLDEEMFAVYDMVSQDFAQVLDTLEEVLIKDAHRQFKDAPEDLKSALAEIQKNMSELRNRNYFPLTRFGEYFVRVKTMRDQVIEGVTYKTGEITSFETFETKKAMDKRLRQLQHRKDLKAVGGVLTDTQRMFAGFPPQFLQMLKNRLGLTEEQQAELAQLMHDIAPGQSFTKHMKQRKNTPGFSQDAIRSYANYFLHFSNHIARLQHKGELLDAIKEVQDSADTLRNEGKDAVKRDLITQHLQRHYDYIMNPVNELANLRALGFIWYLGFVPKSAVVNLTQVPLVTLPYLSARYGDAQAMQALLKAQKDVYNYWRKPQKLTPGQHAMLEELKRSGIIDESMATEIAATAEGSVLQRLVPGTFLKSEFAGRAVRDFAGRAAWLFQQAEKLNRRITALAAYDLAKGKGMKHAEAVKAAWDAVESTQYEYARWNRAAFMRGKPSTIFLFWQYLQNTLFFAGHDPGALRFIVMLFLMAGLSGLPGAEDLMDIYDYLARKYNKWTGREDASISIRKDLREFINELGMNPDLMMHGASRYSFGLPAVGDAIGVPIPNVDMSGSLSLGRIIPGIDPVFGRQGDFDTRMARAAEEGVGAVWTMPIQLMRAIADDNPNALKRFEKAMPSFARNLSKAYRYAAEQEETVRSGAALAEFDLQDSKHVAEILMQAAGFAPTRVNEIKEKYYLTKEIAEYYEIRRRQFMRMLNFARKNNDSKMEVDVWKEINKFNKTVPHPVFILTGEDIKRSIKDRVQRSTMEEMGIYTSKKQAPLQWDIDKAYPNLDEPSKPGDQGFDEFFEEPVPK